jgi:hypothetical protein
LKKDNFIVGSLTESFTSLIINGYTFKFNLIPYKVLLQLEYEFERHPLCQILRAFFRTNYPKIKNSEYPYFIEAKKELPTESSNQSSTQSLSVNSYLGQDNIQELDFQINESLTENPPKTETDFLSIPKKTDPHSQLELNLNGRIFVFLLYRSLG